MASRLANTGEVLRNGEALAIPILSVEAKSKICVPRGATAPASMSQSVPGIENASQETVGPRISHTRGAMVDTVQVTAVVGEPYRKPSRTQI